MGNSEKRKQRKKPMVKEKHLLGTGGHMRMVHSGGRGMGA